MAQQARRLIPLLGSVAKWGTAISLGTFAAQECLYDGTLPLRTTAPRRHDLRSLRQWTAGTAPLFSTASAACSMWSRARACTSGSRASRFAAAAAPPPATCGAPASRTHVAAQYPNVIDIRTRFRTISADTGSKDLQTVAISLRVLSHPDEEFLPWIFKNLGIDFDQRVLPSIGPEVLRSVVVRGLPALAERAAVAAAAARGLRSTAHLGSPGRRRSTTRTSCSRSVRRCPCRSATS